MYLCAEHSTADDACTAAAFPPAISAALPAGLHRALIHATRALFSLAVAASGGSRNALARAIELDPRTIDGMTTAPSLTVVARVGDEMGMGAASAVEVVSRAARCPWIRGRGLPDDHDALVALTLDADLTDDSVLLEHCSERLWSAARSPAELAFAQLVLARALVARGEITGAARSVRLALQEGVAPDDRPAASQLVQAIRFESMLGSPCERSVQVDAGVEFLAEALEQYGKRASCETRDARLRAWHVCASVLRDETGASAAAARLLDRLDVPQDPRAAVWTASIVAMTAARVIDALPRGSTQADGMARVFVCAQLALEGLAVPPVDGSFDRKPEALSHQMPESTESAIRALRIARHSRVAMLEWSLRARHGEIADCVLDEADRAELLRGALRFGSADGARELRAILCAPKVTVLNKIPTWELDAWSSSIGMVGQVPSLPASGAVAASRSEDQC